MYKLLVFGNGGLWSVIKGYIDLAKVEIIAFIISDGMRTSSTHDGVPIISPSQIKDCDYDFILLASGNHDALISQLVSQSIPNEKIISFKLNDSKVFRALLETTNNEIVKLGNYRNFELFSTQSIDSFGICNMSHIGRARHIELNDKHVDYIRLSSLDLIADEINSNSIPGNVAEVGVYRGDFAKHINKVFPDRKLYLFDTFEGFDIRDVGYDIEKNYSIRTTQFSDTSIDLVLEKMEFIENVVVRKGYFPETINGLEDHFAFVSIDVDLYKPIYDALNYFYPRLSKGGYIFIHDYNNAIYKGAKKAVRDYCSENKIPFVPISDNLGTAVISK